MRLPAELLLAGLVAWAGAAHAGEEATPLPPGLLEYLGEMDEYESEWDAQWSAAEDVDAPEPPPREEPVHD